MKIQCPKCNATCNIDESKIPERGAYLRCKKCQNKFHIEKPSEDIELETEEAITENKKEATTQCPFCKEEIVVGAIKCKHCGSMLTATKKGKYTEYSQVPWYRKNSFIILSWLFFWPVSVVIMWTGSIYYVKKGQLKTYGKIAKVILTLMPLIGTILLFSSVSSDSDIVHFVKSGKLNAYPQKTVGEAIDGFFGNPKWEAITGEDGKTYVNVIGNISYMNEEVKAKLQFKVAEDKTFETTALEFNNVPQNLVILNALIEKMYE